MNKILLLYMKIESKSSAFGINKSSPGKREDLVWSFSYGRMVELRPKTYLVFVVIGRSKGE